VTQASGKKGGRLWKHGDFVRFWFGMSVSNFGNQITNLALPTIAILLLHITIFEVGLLGTIEYLAYPAIGLFVGVWVDRFRRKPILIACNLGRLVSLASIPIAYLLNVLSIYQIFAVAGVNGVFSVFFDVAYQSYLPSLVDPSDLVEGNSKLQTTASAATVIGPGLAGFLINLVGAAESIAVDALGYLTSILAMLSIRKKEERPSDARPDRPPRSFASEMREGIALIIHSPVLASLTGCVSTINFGTTLASSVYVYFAYNELHLTPLLVGIVGSAGGLAFLIGALTASRVSEYLGIGRALTFSILTGFGYIGYPLALVLPALPTLIAFSFIASSGVLIFNITALSMMQKTTPNELLGRMTATRRTISWGVIPVASLLGGVLGSVIGIPATIIIGGSISGGAVLWALLGPIYRLKEVSDLDVAPTA
jgi:MFS family permease